MKIIRHPWAPRAGVRTILGVGLGLVLGVLAGASCTVESVYTCVTNEDCVEEGGEGGVCEPNNLCTFPDMACPSGKRWHERAAELASKCYDPSHLGGGTDSVADTAGSSDGSEAGSTSTGPDPSTTLPADDTAADSSSGGPPPMTDDGTTTGVDLNAQCDAVFDSAPGYLLCEATETTCSFNVTVAMTSCTALCMTFGATCVDGFENSASDCASQGASIGCEDAAANDNICVCAKP